MAKKAETVFKERVWKLLKVLPRTYVRKIQNRTVRGLPDFFMCIRGFFIALELKVGGDVEPLQKWNIEEIMNAGGCAMPVTPDNWDEVYSILHDIAIGNQDIKEMKLKAPRVLDS